MRVAILQCDEVLDKFQAQYGDYSEMIIQMFDTFDDPFEFQNFDCQQGHYPKDTDYFDFFITTGSRASAYEEKPWIQQLITFVKQLEREKKKLIGICFGHQIMAIARQGKVAKSKTGWGVGIATNRIVAKPPWMDVVKDELNIIVSHQDQVTVLPAGALVIAESDFCPYFIVQWSDHFLSIQGHPEWDRAYSRSLINERKSIIPPRRIESGLSSLTTEPDNRLFIHWVLNFVKHSA